MTSSTQDFDVIIIGAGAAGLMCAASAARRGRTVLVLDHAKKVGEKIRISGGGRCNFTNRLAGPENYVSQNPRFCISALKRFTQHDFIEMIENRGIAYHERDHGQLFCDDSASQIVDMLVDGCTSPGAGLGARIQLGTHINAVEQREDGFELNTDHGSFTCRALVIATGGKSIPKIGATGFGYDLAKKFGLRVVPVRAGLAPLTFDGELLAEIKELAGIAIDARIRCHKSAFREALLFTHRGLSGPAILQISSYWNDGDELRIDLAPGIDAFEVLKTAKAANPKQDVATVVATLLPKRLAKLIVAWNGNPGRIIETGDKVLRRVAEGINDWRVTPNESEGYRTAEVTVGGVDTRDLSSKTMEAKTVPGLYFIGEVVDVTGELGGFNFQWAWSSGYAAGEAV